LARIERLARKKPDFPFDDDPFFRNKDMRVCLSDDKNGSGS
jgi:hypothetical protein